MADFTRVAKVDEVEKGKCKHFVVNGKNIALFNDEGKFFATENECPHQGGPLSEGDFANGVVTCPWHNWKFDVKTGDCTVIDTINVVTFKTKVENDEVFVKV